MDGKTHRKKQQLLQALYRHCAANGMSELKSSTSVARILQIKRPLFYFYFEDLDACINALINYHMQVIDRAFEEVTRARLSFIEYVHYLVDIGDLYFFSIQCMRYQSQYAGFLACMEHSLTTLDAYNFEQFVVYYGLEGYPEESMRFMYSSFREYWWTHSGEYENWGHDKVDELVAHVDALVELLKGEAMTSPS